MRPDKLSYLVDVNGKIFVRSQHMSRPAKKGGVFGVQVQGGAQTNAEVGVLPRRSERLKQKRKESKSLSFDMCGSNDNDDAKLREYRRLDRLHWEQLAKEMQIESESNTIRQNAGGFPRQ